MAAAPSRRQVLLGMSAMVATGARSSSTEDGRPPNILFITIDDLNDWVGVLGGHVQARTPNLDRLSRQGILFDNAHCPAPACNPSRTAILTGIRPSTSGVYTNDQPWRAALPSAMTLPRHLRSHGYQTVGAGKVFHFNDPLGGSWDEYYPSVCTRVAQKPGGRPVDSALHVAGINAGATREDDDDVLSDGQIADWVGQQLQRDFTQPFFLACGFYRPHLPWYVPVDYFNLYNAQRIVLPVVKPDDLGDIPEAGRRMAHIEMHEQIVQKDAWAKAVHGYLASLSYADAMLGQVLRALRRSPYRRNTLVVVLSDHGWSLGEKFHWKKFALWEECTRIPLILAGPGLLPARCTRPVNLIDLFPTLSDLCGLPTPPELEGRSFAPLVRQPSLPWPGPTLTTHEHNNHALRDERWRYIRYADGSEELYDHSADPNEWVNLASRPELAAEKERLARFLPTFNAEPAASGQSPCDTYD